VESGFKIHSSNTPTPHNLKLVFIGTPDFSVPSLKAMAASSHEVALAICQPDRQSGRGKKTTPPPVKEAASALGIPVFQPVKVSAPESIEHIRQHEPDVLAVVAYGQKLSNELLVVPRLGSFNLHGSILPKYRGAAPITYAVWNGEPETGLTIFRMVEKMDAGEMGIKVTTQIGPDETAGELHDRLSLMGADLFVEFLDKLEAGQIQFVAQDESQATIARSLKKEQGLIDWSQPGEAICRHIRAMTPWPGAYTFYPAEKQSQRLTVLKASLGETRSVSAPGTILEAGGDTLLIATGDGDLLIHRLVPAGKKPMDIGPFLRGHQLEAGNQLGPE